jgi:hypothetical protein
MRVQRALIVGAIAWTVLIGIFFMFGPVYVTASASYGANQPGSPAVKPIETHATGFQVNGYGRMGPIALPIVLAAAPLFAGKSRRVVQLVAGTLLLVFCMLAALSIGAFYLPAAIVTLLGAIPSRHVPGAT